MANDTKTHPAVETVTFTLNGKSLTVPRGTSVLQAALESGVNVPYFCYHPKLKSVGSCRMCYVEIEKFPKLMVSCCTEATSGMVVHTESDLVKRGRKAVIEFTLINHPLDCPTCDKGGECDLQNLTFAHGFDDSRFDFQKYRFVDGESKSTFDDLKIGPEIVLNRNRCILCYKCVRANKEAFGEYDLGAYERGNITEINAAPGEEVDNPFSGNLVEICPVGALTNSDWRYQIRVWLTQTTESIDQFSSSGSNILFTRERHQNRVFRTTSRRNDQIDDGWLSDVARYGYQIAMADSRLKTPLMKKGDAQVAVSWDEALDTAAKRLAETKTRKGSVAVGGVISPHLDLAAVYRFQSLMSEQLESPNIDFRAEYKHVDSGDAPLFQSLTEAPFSIEQLDTSDVILVIGSDLHREHLNEYLRIRKATTRLNGRLFLLNPYETKAADCATLELIYRAGHEIQAITALVHAGIDSGAFPDNGFRAAAALTAADALAASGCRSDELSVVARALAEAHQPTVLVGELVTRSPRREEIAQALCNLRIACTMKPAGQFAVLARHANSIGASRLGVFPRKNGRSASAMIAAAAKGDIASLVVVGAQLLQTMPGRAQVEAALKKLDCLIVADLCESELTRMADIVFPISSWAEHSGSFVNLEGRLQQFHAAIAPRFDSRPVAELLSQLAARISGTPSPGAAEVQELAQTRVAAFKPPTLPANFASVKPETLSPPAGSVPLFVVDDPHHYLHLTEHAHSLSAFCGEAFAELSESLAKRLQVKEHDRVRIENEHGKLILPVRISTVLESDVVLVPRNFASTPVTLLQSQQASVDWVTLTRVAG